MRCVTITWIVKPTGVAANTCILESATDMWLKDRKQKRDARIAKEEAKQAGRDRLAQFALVYDLNEAIEDNDYVTLTELLDIDLELVANMTITEWQQVVLVRLHDFCESVGIEYRHNWDIG